MISLTSKFRLIAVCAAVFTTIAGGCSQADQPPAAAAPVVSEWDKLRELHAYDAKKPLGVKLLKSESNLMGTLERYTLIGAKGASVPFHLMLPHSASADTPIPCVVLVHGKEMNIGQMIPVMMLFAARGYASVAPEIVGHGARYDANSPLFGEDMMRLRDGLLESSQDVRRTIDFLVTVPEIDKSRIGLLGLSLGTSIGGVVAGLDDRVSTAVFGVGGADWKIILNQSQESYPRKRRAGRPITEEEWAALETVDPGKFIGHMAPRPVLMINGTQDDIMPRDAAEALFKAANEPKKQVWVEAGHMVEPGLVAPHIFDWFNTHLK